MARLEYRQYGEWETQFPLLYYYDGIDQDEVSLRFACDYFVKDGVVYEKTSCSIEPHAYVIYVRRSADEYVVDSTRQTPPAFRWGGIRIELREFMEYSDQHPVRHTFRYSDDDDALLCLQSDYLVWDGSEWAKTSAEIDEDRRVYVYYATRTAAGRI
ncbi:hypothetical protein [Paenibacillus sp. y28]|uniref:hypothetical protein n=1 Tax=Paenibacillus sp. y28 TaxID=3129110 RepID=UPI003015B037